MEALKRTFKSFFVDSPKYKLVEEGEEPIRLMTVPMEKSAEDMLYKVINAFSDYVLTEALEFSKRRGEPVIITSSDIAQVLNAGPIDLSIKKEI